MPRAHGACSGCGRDLHEGSRHVVDGRICGHRVLKVERLGSGGRRVSIDEVTEHVVSVGGMELKFRLDPTVSPGEWYLEHVKEKE